jgi:hypothetical protein
LMVKLLKFMVISTVQTTCHKAFCVIKSGLFELARQFVFITLPIKQNDNVLSNQLNKYMNHEKTTHPCISFFYADISFPYLYFYRKRYH